MPIIRPTPLRLLTQDEFRDLSFAVKGVVIDIHREFGRFFDEHIYKLELARRLPSARLEVPIDVTHRDFSKRYFLDVLVGDGGLFEFKAVDAFSPRHRAQAIHYLMLCDLQHAMLVATRAERVASEFVNTSHALSQRLHCRADTTHWDAATPGAAKLEEFIRSLLADWGAGLDLSLYEEALIHFLGGESVVVRPAAVLADGARLAEQNVLLAADGVAFKLTAFGEIPPAFASHARHFVAHTDLRALLWINLSAQCATFTTIKP